MNGQFCVYGVYDVSTSSSTNSIRLLLDAYAYKKPIYTQLCYETHNGTTTNI